MPAVLEGVRALRATVRECLSALDAAAPDDPEVGRAFSRLAQGFEDLGDLRALLAQAGEERAALADELNELTRLHAVLTATVSRDRDKLCLLLEQARQARSRVQRRGLTEVVTGTGVDTSA
ncbi:MAG: hypothetical protein O2816_00080 [Planctomycetota bacterium]|nr:hypothetical protein [Planctomycetota bacterium]